MERFDVQPLYRALVENAQDILGVLTSDGVIVTVSPAARRVLNLHPDRIRGKHWIDQIHPDDRTMARRWMASCAANDDNHQRVQLRAGRPPTWRVLELSGVAVSEDAYTNRIVFSARDATDEVAATQLLAEREARFRSAFHDAPIGKALLDSKAQVLEANRAFATILDRWNTELEGESFLEFFDQAEGSEALHEAWSEAADATKREVALTLDRRGRPVHLRVLFAPVVARGEAFALAQVQDFTARIEAELALDRNLRQLRQNNRRLHEMAWMASHDLKEPLRGMVGSLQLILRRHGEQLGDTEKATAEQAVQQAKALRQRLDELEKEVGAGSGEYAAMLALGELLSEWKAVHQSEIDQARVSIQAEEMPSFRADRRVGVSFQSVLDQALAWAIASDEQQPRIRVASQWSGKHWTLSIQTAAPGGMQTTTLTEPGGDLFGLRSETEERGASLELKRVDSGELIFRLLVIPD